MRILEEEVGQGSYRIWGSLSLCSEGAALVIFGGERPHIGSVVLTEIRPSLAKGSHDLSTTSSVINRRGHKDEVVAREAATRVALKLQRPVSATVGIHIPNATAEDLEILIEHARQLVNLLIEEV